MKNQKLTMVAESWWCSNLLKYKSFALKISSIGFFPKKNIAFFCSEICLNFVCFWRRIRRQFEFPAKLKYHALRSNVNFKTKSVKKFRKFSFFFSKAEQFWTILQIQTQSEAKWLKEDQFLKKLVQHSSENIQLNWNLTREITSDIW